MLHNQRRYRGMMTCALAIVIVGIYLGEQWIIALSILPLTFIVFDALSGVPDPELTVERTIAPDKPIPADDVAVELTVENAGPTVVPDLRLSDGVPAELPVTDGQRTGATTLGPEQSETITYTLEAKRGTHTFDPPHVRIRGSAASSYREVTPTVHGDTEFAARVFLDDAPTMRETTTLVGAVTSDTAGSGVEFHTVRKYRPGDPINRIDWRRLARDGELSTVNFRERGGLSVIVVADCRPDADLVPHNAATPGSDLCQYAADRILTALSSADHDVGFAVLTRGASPWIPPETSDMQVRARRALRSLSEGTWEGGLLAPDPSSGERTLTEQLLSRLAPGTQIVVLTPLGDAFPVELGSELRAHGHRVTVLSPDLGTPETTGVRLDCIKRARRLQQLREEGATVIDWPRSASLPVTLSNATVGGGP